MKVLQKPTQLAIPKLLSKLEYPEKIRKFKNVLFYNRSNPANCSACFNLFFKRKTRLIMEGKSFSDVQDFSTKNSFSRREFNVKDTDHDQGRFYTAGYRMTI